MDESASTKRCAHPDHEGPNPLPLTDFSGDKRTRDGLASRCRACAADCNTRYRAVGLDGYEVDREAKNARECCYRAANRDIVLAHYSPAYPFSPRCACCRSTGDLTIDHVGGGGTEHRKGLGNFYAWLIRQGFPPGYQVLCMSCNCSKGETERCRIDHRQAA